jgi:predicted CoA-binding protein
MRHASVSTGLGGFRERRWSPSVGTVQDPITRILEQYKTLVVVGLSSRPTRPSHGVAAYMKDRGYRIIAVNPNEKIIFGQKVYASLQDVPGTIDVVVIFRKPEHVPDLVETAIRHGAKVIWMQEGVVHEVAACHAREAGLDVIQDRCILKEYAKRFVTEEM